MAVVDTSTSTAALPQSNARSLAIIGTTWWQALYDGTDLTFEYSTDNGATWTQDTGASLTLTTPEFSLRADESGNLHLAYNEGTVTCSYRRGTISSSAITWTSATSLGSLGRHPDLAVHAESGGWRVHCVGGLFTSTAQVQYARLAVSAAGTITTDAAAVGIWSSGTSSLASPNPSIDFRHTGDGKTVASSSPDLFLAFREQWNGNERVSMKKASYSAGTWTWGTNRILDAAVAAAPSAFFDGTRFVVAYRDDTAMKVAERDAADTATTTRTPTALSDGAIVAHAAGWTSEYDIVLFACGTTSDDPKWLRFDRSAGTWDGSWTTIEATTIAGQINAAHGFSSFRVPVSYVEGGGSPWDITATSADFNTAPTGATWVTTTGLARDVDATLELDWTFVDPDTGDTQSAYALKRVGPAGTHYFQASDETWQSGEIKNTSATTSVTLDAAWATESDTNYTFSVKTWDASDSEGVYGDTLVVIPSEKVEPSISSPTDASTITTSTVTVTWSVDEQSEYRIKLYTDTGAVLNDSGWVANSVTRTVEVAYDLDNTTDYEVGVQTRNTEGLDSTEDVNTFTTGFTAPPAPTISMAEDDTLGKITVTITNDAPEGDEPDLTENRLYRRELNDESTEKRIAVGLGEDATYADYAVASGTTYEYRCQAIGDNGTSAYSDWTE